MTGADDEFNDALTDTEPAWRYYEDQILDRLQEKAGDEAVVEPDQHLPGRFSKVSRQIDVLVRGSFGGLPEMLVVVDCKCWSRRVTVADVEQLIGMVEDVEASLGVLITNKGASKAAERRGGRSVQVEVVPFDQLSEWTRRLPTIAYTTGTDWATLSYYEAGELRTEAVSAEFAESVRRRLELRSRRLARMRAKTDTSPTATRRRSRRRRARPRRRG